MGPVKLVEMAIEDLVMADYNPRSWSDREKADLDASLKEFGFVDPVIVNVHPKRKNTVVGGHFRISRWKEMGNTRVPCVLVSLTLAKEKELNIRLNKNTGSFDFKLLEEHFAVDDLLHYGFQPADFGVSTIPTMELGGTHAPPPEMPRSASADTSMVQLFFTTESKAVFIEAIRIVQKKYGIDNITDAALRAAQDARTAIEAGSK